MLESGDEDDLIEVDEETPIGSSYRSVRAPEESHMPGLQKGTPGHRFKLKDHKGRGQW